MAFEQCYTQVQKVDDSGGGGGKAKSAWGVQKEPRVP